MLEVILLAKVDKVRSKTYKEDRKYHVSTLTKEQFQDVADYVAKHYNSGLFYGGEFNTYREGLSLRYGRVYETPYIENVKKLRTACRKLYGKRLVVGRIVDQEHGRWVTFYYIYIK